MIGIVVALNSEVEKLLTKVDELNEISLADKKAYSCKVANKEVIIAISGIGKVNAAITTQLLIDKFSPDFILNFGTCGGTNKSVEILKYYAITKCAQFDFDLRELDGVPLGYIQDYDTVFFPTNIIGLDYLEESVLASSDRFTDNPVDIDNINQMGASVRDMEGGAIAQTCVANKVPLFMIKGISDVVGSGTAQEQFFKNLKTVGEGFPAVIIKAVENISKALKI